MKSIELNKLTEDDILALDISTNDGCVILTKGTVLKKYYINKLCDFGIKQVFVENTLTPEFTSLNYTDLTVARETTLKNYCA
ncbi:MAG: hypothetical protein RR645_05130, partial [Clostridium sp.]